jgi:hypothetical protein
VSQPRWRPTPPAGTIPKVVPSDLVLVRKPGLVVWMGAITAFPEGFEFTLLTLFDSSGGQLPADFALFPSERNSKTWVELRYADGRHREADLNENTPRGQLEGPHLTLQDGTAARHTWWVTPLPPPGPVELAIHLAGEEKPTGIGVLDGALVVEAAKQAEILWPGGNGNND